MEGTRLGPYRLDRELGAGGMGKVWAARLEGRVPGLDVGALVALKVVHPHLLETPGFFKRFLREAEIGRAVVHENVVRTFDCDSLSVDGKRADFLVMEYVEGQTLRGLLAELDRVPEELCRHIGREVAKGLAAIHAAGVVHRDMKPENVIISRCTAPGHDHVAERPGAQRRVSEGNVHLNCDHAVKVMDLGVARLQDEAMRLSQTGAFVGSLHYAAPECFSEGGKHVDGRADLHALGLVLYELACGTNPYFADDIPQTLKRVLHEEPRRLGDVNPQFSPFFEEVVHNLLAKRPADRFADAATLLRVLEEGEKSAWWTARSKAIRAVTHQPLRRIRIPRETAVYGREDDLALLRARFARATKGDGQVVVIEGEAGIGKSRVVDELIGRLQRDGEDLNFLFGSYPPGGAATAAGAFSTAFREQFGSDGSAAYLTATPVLVPAFEALLRGETTPEGREPLTKDSLQTCFVHAVRGLAAERVTVLLIDDLHFATEDARSLFTTLALAVPGHRVLLIGTTRPGIDEKWLAGLTRLPQTSQIALHRLGPKDLAALLGDSLRSEALALSLAGQIGQKSDGNPFFVFEIIRGLRDGQFLTQRDDGTWVSTRVIGDIRIPSSILDLVNARVADLTQEERDVLDVASCWGFEFDAALVAEVTGIARIPLYKQLAQIERAHRLVRSSGRNFVFDHHQVQEALYGSLPEVLREEYHAALATALETRAKAADSDPATLDGALCVDLCEHFLRGYPCVAAGGAQRTGTVPDEGREPDSPGASQAVPRNSATALPTEHPALRYLAPALTHLEKGYLHDAAVRLAERALAAPGLLAGKERVEILLRRALRLEFLGRRDAERAALDEAQSLTDALGDPALRARALRALGGHLRRVSRLAEAEISILAALALARAVEDRKAVAAATGSLGLVVWSLGRHAEAGEQHERHLAFAREIGDVDGECIATTNLGLVSNSFGRYAEAREHFERANALARQCGNRRWEGNAAGNLGNVSVRLGRYAEARGHLERQLALSRETGDRGGEARATGDLGLIFSSLGRHAEAREHHERQIALARDTGDRVGEAVALDNLGAIHIALGEPAPARRRLEESLALCREIGARRDEGYVLANLAEVADAEGDAGAALLLAEASLALRREISDRGGIVESLRPVAELRRRAGQSESARSALEEALRLSREQGRAAKAAHALAMLACLPGGDAATAVAALAEAGPDADTSGVRFLLWQAPGDRAHLAAAKRLLDEALAKVPAEHHAAMLGNVRVNREIVAACRAAGIA